MNFVIKERDASEIAPVLPMISKAIPPCGRDLSKAKSLPKRDQTSNSRSKLHEQQQETLNNPIAALDNSQFEDEYMKANHEMLGAMTDEEMMKNIDELKLSVSHKSMEIMQSSKFKKKVGLLPSQSIVKSKAPTAEATGSAAGAPSPPQAAAALQQPPALKFDMFNKMPSTLEELEEMKKNAPLELRCQMEWMMTKDAQSKTEDAEDKDNHAPSSSGSMFVRSLNRSKYDRFALDGSKVVHKDKTIEDVRSVLAILGLSKDKTAMLSQSLVTSLLRIGFCVEPNLSDTQPQDELLHHEQDPDEPGYSFMEISEMFRSEEKHQRSLAVTMLGSILKKRDDAVSLEAYGLDSRGADASKLEGAFQLTYGSIVTALVEEEVWGSEPLNACGLTYKQDAYIRRILTFVILLTCAADLPVALPTLLLWGLRLRLSVPARLSLLVSVRNFLFCSHEERASSMLWLGLWGLYGCPTLPTPHDRRMELSYEEYVAHCLSSRDKEITAEEATDNPQAPPTMKSQRSLQDEFAVRNRWGRIDAMVQDGDLAQSLSQHLQESLIVLLENNSDSSIAPLLESSRHLIFVVLDMCSAAVRIGESSTAQAIIDTIIRKHWKLLHGRIAASTGSKDLILIQAAWYRLLAESCRRARTLACWISSQPHFMSCLLSTVVRICQHSSESSSPHATSDKADDALIWILRLWRVLLCYCLGTESVSELLLAAQTPNGHPLQNSNRDRAVSFGPGLLIQGDANAAEFFSFLEQAAVSCASMITTGIPLTDASSVPPSMHSLIELSQLLIGAAEKTVTETFLRYSGCEPDEQLPIFSSLHFVASTLGLREWNADLPPQALQLKTIYNAAMIRGPGLLPACSACLSHFRQSGNTLDARLAHVDGLAESLLLACGQSMPSALQFIETITDTASKSNSFLLRWRRDEVAFSLYRLKAGLATYGISLGRGEEGLIQASQPKATDGLFAWQSQRLWQACALNALQKSVFQGINTARDVDYSAQSALVMETLTCLGQGMVGPAVSLVTFLVESMLDSAVAANDTSRRLRDFIINGLFCVTRDAEERKSLLYDGELSTSFLLAKCLSGDGESLSSTTISDWIQLPYNPKLPLSSDWFLKCLPALSGQLFETWLSTVALMESRRKNSIDQRTASDDREQSSKRLKYMADKLYFVLKVANPESSQNWLHSVTSSDVSTSAATAFCHLVTLYFVEMFQQPGSINVRDVFIQSVAAESFDARSVVTPGGNRAPRNTPAEKREGNSESGLIELCGKVLDSAMVPLLDHNVHCCALMVMLCPLLSPWKAQQKVWLELGTARCIHLLECPDNLFLPFVPYFVVQSGQYSPQVGVMRAIVHALRQLRKPSVDRLWPICSIGIHLLSAFIFFRGAQETDGTIMLDAARSKLLLELIGAPSWVLYDLLAVAAAHSQLIGITSSKQLPKNTTDAEEYGRSLVEFWRGIRGDEMPTRETFLESGTLSTLPCVCFHEEGGSGRRASLIEKLEYCL